MRNCSLRVSLTLMMFVCALGAYAGGKGREICRVETRSVSKEIPFEVQYKFSRLVGPGRCIKVQNGEAGSVIQTYQLRYVDGQLVGKELVDTEKVAAKPAVYYMGKHGIQTSRGSFSRSKILNMKASAYDPSPATIGRGATGRTATGRRAGFGCVAVDPRTIPLGTMVFVEGYGFALACDKGSAIKGDRIDLCYGSRSQALRFGRKSVRVHVFKGR
jgi:3D (Asp-Asp-Asp) domain-containing protein